MLSDKRPMISVIMLTYNHEKYVRQALDSILMQKVNFEYEILIGDDCSSDNTRRILREYKNLYPNTIRLFLNSCNIGATKNACQLLKSARGKYLAACEGDDYWTDQNKLSIQVDFLEKNSQFVGCTHLFTIVDEEGNPYNNQYLSWVRQKDEFSIEDFKGYILPGQPSTFVRKNLFFNNLISIQAIYETHFMIGDRTAMLLFLMHGKFGIIKRNMSCYRRCKIEKKSITDLIYRKHFDAINSDYEMTCKLENISREHNLNLKFDQFKKILFTKAFVFFLLKMNFSFFRLAFMIFKESGYDFRYIINVPVYIVTELKNRIG